MAVPTYQHPTGILSEDEILDRLSALAFHAAQAAGGSSHRRQLVNDLRMALDRFLVARAQEVTDLDNFREDLSRGRVP